MIEELMRKIKQKENLNKIFKEEERETNTQEKEIQNEDVENKKLNNFLKSKIENIKYKLPPLELLDTKTDSNQSINESIIIENSQKLQKVLYNFKVMVKVKNAVIGPTVITYEIELAEGTSVKSIKKLKDELELYLGTKINDIKIIPEKRLVGIETERIDKEIVTLGNIIKTENFINSKSKLTIAFGTDMYGKPKLINIEETSHILISGTTGSGKSMFLHTLINSILYKAKPSEVKFLMIDTKMVELSLYNGIPHLLIPVVGDRKKAIGLLAWLCQEMDNRYEMLENKKVKNINEYNETQDNIEVLPYIILIIDEYADLVELYHKEFEKFIYTLIKNGEKVGIYIIISTERPSINIINGTIKSNISTRIAFRLPSQIDSKVVMDTAGAENLLGNGDMLYKEQGIYKPIRYQGAFVSDEEIKRIVNYVKHERTNIYNENIMQSIENHELKSKINTDNDIDPLLMEAIEAVVKTGQVSTAFIQREFKIGYARAGRIIDQMEEKGIISCYQGSKPRKVLISIDTLNKLKRTEVNKSTYRNINMDNIE